MAKNYIPANYNDLLDSLMLWGRTGLILDTKVIKSYHPPSLDNVTNVAVPMPATVFKTGKTIPKPYERSYIFIDELPNASHTGSNVVDFNVNTIPTGPDTNLSHEAPKYGPFYKDSALTQDAATYYANTKKLAIPVVADRTASELKVKHSYITDKYDDAKTFYSTPPLPFASTATTDKYPIDTRRPIPKRYELMPTRVPCAIPGTLNCYMAVYDSVDVTQPKYNYRKPNIVMNYKKGKDRIGPNGDPQPGNDELYLMIDDDFTENRPLSAEDRPDNPNDYPGDE